MKGPKTYYHLTSSKMLELIKKEGIKCSHDKHIYLLDENEAYIQPFNLRVRISDILAKNQLGLSEYVLISVDAKGITSQIKPDNVAEVTAGNQKRVKQKMIEHKYLSDFKKHKTKIKEVELFQLAVILLAINPSISNKQPKDIRPMYKKLLVNPS